jgi:hypothetical protein
MKFSTFAELVEGGVLGISSGLFIMVLGMALAYFV